MTTDKKTIKQLCTTFKKKIPFYEVDAIQMVWHGNYLKYMEEGREAFGEAFDLSYLKIFDAGFVIPIVDLKLQYKTPAAYGDTLIIKTTYVPCRSAKLLFTYEILRENDNTLIMTAQSAQLFVHKDSNEFELSAPEFLSEWRTKMAV